MQLQSHNHDETRIIDPINGHEWHICRCGFALDLNIMRGNCA